MVFLNVDFLVECPKMNVLHQNRGNLFTLKI